MRRMRWHHRPASAPGEAVRPVRQAAEIGDGAAAGNPSRQRLPYKHVLLPLDGSDVAETAIPEAEAVARGCGARISIVHVVNSGRYYKLTLAGRRPPDYLNRVAERLRKNGVQTVDVRALTGDPARAILACSEADGCDLIVVASRARPRFRHWAGGVAASVLRKSRIPVLSVRVKDG